ncbi:MAG: AMP-binding protein [Thermodesulfobacteriota bacterium]
MGLYDFSIYDLICRNAVSFRDRPAWFEVDDGRRLNFGGYKQKADGLARGLQKTGIRKGDRIGALGKNSLEYFLLYGAAAALGALMVPVNWRLSAEEIAFNLNDCTPKLLFADEEYQGLVSGIQNRLPSVQSYFNLKADAGGFNGFESLMTSAGAFEAPEVASDDGFVIIHTAAVTGRPRGALLSHANILAAGFHMNHLFGMTPADVHLNLLPLFHVAGLTMAFQAFHAGARSVNISKFDARQTAELIDAEKVSVLYEFSPILASILTAQVETGRDIKSLRAVLGLDRPETIEQYQQATGGIFYCVYGQTETSGLATLGKYNDRPGAAGKILHLADVRLVDENDHSLAPGEIGEITVKGPLVFKGYWNLAEDTARAFRGGRHHTGDLGRFDEDGFLWYEGRKADKELIKPGGENVYPAEVERVILQHPAVAKTVVFGVPDPKWKEGIKAVCLLEKGQSLAARELIRFVGERIASFKKPQYVEFVTDFPVLKDGTPDRAKIKAKFGGGA